MIARAHRSTIPYFSSRFLIASRGAPPHSHRNQSCKSFSLPIAAPEVCDKSRTTGCSAGECRSEKEKIRARIELPFWIFTFQTSMHYCCAGRCCWFRHSQRYYARRSFGGNNFRWIRSNCNFIQANMQRLSVNLIAQFDRLTTRVVRLVSISHFQLQFWFPYGDDVHSASFVTSLRLFCRRQSRSIRVTNRMRENNVNGNGRESSAMKCMLAHRLILVQV